MADNSVMNVMKQQQQQQSELVASLHQEIKRLQDKYHEAQLALFGLAEERTLGNICEKVVEIEKHLGISSRKSLNEWHDVMQSLDGIINNVKRPKSSIGTSAEKARLLSVEKFVKLSPILKKSPEEIQMIRKKVFSEQLHTRASSAYDGRRIEALLDRIPANITKSIQIFPPIKPNTAATISSHRMDTHGLELPLIEAKRRSIFKPNLSNLLASKNQT